MEKFILALDQGTTGTTVCILDRHAKSVATINKEHTQIYPKPGWVEHDPEAIWNAVTDGIKEALSSARLKPEQIAAIGITNQRETVVIWDKTTHRPVYNAIVWQCRRTTDFCNKLKKSPKAKIIAKKTGLVVDPYFSASKLRWLLDNVIGLKAQAKAGQVKAGTIDSFLLWRLTEGTSHKTDVSNASRTQLMNIEKGGWDPELGKIFGVPLDILPEIAASNATFGKTKNVPGLPDGIPITGIAGDQQAALFGQACFDVGASKCTFGTGSFLLMNTGAKRVVSKSGLLTTVAWQLKGDKKLTYALEGGAFICGAAVQWLRDQMQFIKSSAEVESLARSIESTDGVYLVPAFVGLGAPYWDPDARAAIVGMTRGTTRAHLARATLEAMALQNVDILLAMEKDLGKRMGKVRVDGGAVRNDLLMQMQTDFLGVTVQRPRQTESTVLGAAFLAGLGSGYWSGLTEIKKVWALEKEFVPHLAPTARKRKLTEWRRAVGRVRG
ncbi:MAG TPA: glycerol kinase GlpK [Bdellovibrionales bacterium]|mgnify:CR=1 FL=1|nr:glycerol kinase GlpK [Bdellovibrionales bacterium]